MQEQVDAQRVQLAQERHKVLQAAPQAVDAPGHDASNSRRAAALQRASNCGRLSRPLAPLMPWSR
jgi:hypothetical protein